MLLTKKTLNEFLFSNKHNHCLIHYVSFTFNFKEDKVDIKKKISDFLLVEDGSISKKSLMLTGAVLMSSIMGAAISAEVGCPCDQHGNCPCGTIEIGDKTYYISCSA